MRRALDLLLRRALAAIADIIPDGVVEQHRILRHDAERGAQRALRHLGDILPADQDLPGLRIVEAKEQPRDRRLARARGADQRQRLARFDPEAQFVQNLPVGIIAEIDIAELDRGLADVERRRIRDIDDLGGGIDQVEHRRHVDQPLADRAIYHAEQVERAEQLHQQRVHEHQIADGELPPAPAPDGIGHCAGHHQVGDQRLADIEQRERVFGFDRRIGIGARGIAIALGLALLGGEIFDRLVIEQRIDRAGELLAIERVHRLAQMVAPVGDLAGEDDIDRHHRHRCQHQSEAEIDPEDHQHRDEFEHRRGNVEQQEIEHHVDALGAALDHLGDLAGAAGEVEAQRQPVQLHEDVLGERPRCFLADAFEDHVAQIVEQHRSQPRRAISQHRDDRRHRHRGAVDCHPVDCGLVGKGHGKNRRLAQQHHQHRAADAQLQIGPVRWPEIRQESSERLAHGGRRRSIGRGGGLRRHAMPSIGAMVVGSNPLATKTAIADRAGCYP